MDLGSGIQLVMQNEVEPATFEASAITLTFPCLSWVSANGGYAYNTAIGQRWRSQTTKCHDLLDLDSTIF